MPWLFPPHPPRTPNPRYTRAHTHTYTHAHSFFDALASPLCCITASITGLHCKSDSEGKESHTTFSRPLLSGGDDPGGEGGGVSLLLVGGDVVARFPHVPVLGAEVLLPAPPRKRRALPPSVFLIQPLLHPHTHTHTHTQPPSPQGRCHPAFLMEGPLFLTIVHRHMLVKHRKMRSTQRRLPRARPAARDFHTWPHLQPIPQRSPPRCIHGLQGPEAPPPPLPSPPPSPTRFLPGFQGGDTAVRGSVFSHRNLSPGPFSPHVFHFIRPSQHPPLLPSSEGM